MPNKEWKKLNDLDRRLRTLFGTAMYDNDETIFTIRMFGGFEFFNTRPYHNIENWASGYEITTGPKYGSIKVTAEDLDDAIAALERKAMELYGKPKILRS